MSDATSVLFGLEDEFTVLEVLRVDTTSVKMIIEQAARARPCPACGVVSGTVKDRSWMRLKDLPVSGQIVQLWWRKRRLVCAEALCSRKTFTQVSIAVRPRARVTERLRDRVAHAIATGNRAVSEVAAEYGVSWPTAHKALVAAAAKWLPEPRPTSRLGIDETRFASVRWILDGITWKRSDPWLTSFVDCSAEGGGSLLGLAPGRTGARVRGWLGEQTEEFRNKIEIVVIDPSAPYASGIRAALPNVKIAVDKCLVALANQMVTEVRQGVTRDLLGRRATVADPVWVNRRLRSPPPNTSRPGSGRGSPGCLMIMIQPRRLAPPGCEERLRMLLAESEPSKIRRRLADFYDAAIDAQLPEATRLAETMQTWWPAILVALTEDASNARTEGFNRIIKQTKRVGCGYSQHDQLPAPYPEPHCSHPTAEISSMNGTNPAEIRRAG